jgi:hypothetical protein
MLPTDDATELAFASEQVLEARRLLQQALGVLDQVVPAEAAIENALRIADAQSRMETDIPEVQQLLERCAELEAWNARLLAEIEGYQELLSFRSEDRPSSAP